MSVPSARLCRLEYLTPDGWVVGHAGVALLAPERYVERLTDRAKYGRATVLDEALRPTDEVYVSPNLPTDPTVLIPDPPYAAPRMPAPGEKAAACPHCDEVHPAPYDGGCLL